MYIFVDSNDKIVFINPEPRLGLTEKEAFADYNAGEHQMIVTSGFNSLKQKIVNAEIVDKTPKEITEWEIANGIQTITDTQKIDDDGRIINKTQDELIADGLVPLDDLKTQKIDEVNQYCSSLILGGFWSDATGYDKHYKGDRDDQTNLVGAVTANVDMPYKCGFEVIVDDGENQTTEMRYGFIVHTPAQLKQVLLDGANQKSSYLQNAFALKNAIQNATTQTDLLNINIKEGW